MRSEIKAEQGAGARADCASECADGVGGGWEHYPCLLVKVCSV